VKLVVPAARGSVRAALRDAATAAPTYDGSGALDLDATVPGFRLDRYDVALGQGPRDFDRAREGLRTWATHRVPGVRVHPVATPVRLGGDFVVTLGTPFAAIAAPCRVTRVTDDPLQWGFSYRTLPGHPELGEEAFDVSMGAGGEVRLGIVAVSRHAGILLRLGGPAGRLVQRVVTAAYGRALRDYVRAR
jgi:uncharacterized protein (UPF0548 family)